MTEDEIRKAKNEFVDKLKKFNAPIDDIDEVVEKAASICKNSYALRAWLAKIYFQKHPDVAKKIGSAWHLA